MSFLLEAASLMEMELQRSLNEPDLSSCYKNDPVLLSCLTSQRKGAFISLL